MLTETYQTLKECFGETAATSLIYDETRLAALDQNKLLQIMQGEHGKLLRSEFASLRPWCSIMAGSNNSFTIDAAGYVTTCCYDSGHKNQFANIYTDGIREAWRRYKEILLGDLYDMPLCASNCIGGKLPYMPPVLCNNRDALKKSWQEACDFEFPKRVSIEPSALCNYACEGCPANWNAKLLADLDAMYHGLEEGLPKLDFSAWGCMASQP